VDVNSYFLILSYEMMLQEPPSHYTTTIITYASLEKRHLDEYPCLV